MSTINPNTVPSMITAPTSANFLLEPRHLTRSSRIG
jgi:hypothetical protein